MRLLSTLVLTYCFGCIFPKRSNDEVEFKKLHRSRENDLKRTSNNLAINTADKWYIEIHIILEYIILSYLPTKLYKGL